MVKTDGFISGNVKLHLEIDFVCNMGMSLSSCSCRRNRVSSLREVTLLMVGLDNAGKTCTVKHLLGEPTSEAVPTIGFSKVSLKHAKFRISVYDVGGGPKIRGIWKNYFALVHGIIFVVDASDPLRFEECKNVIGNVLKDERISGKPMLLLINKQDIEGATDEAELITQLDIEALVNEQKCPTRVETCCSLYDNNKNKDPGIMKGFDWLVGHISKHFEPLHERVMKEMQIQKVQEEKERAERIERVTKLREEREKAKAESENSTLNNGEQTNDDDDDDVIEGNPFKPTHVIRAELEQKANNFSSSLAERVIHVSPAKVKSDPEVISSRNIKSAPLLSNKDSRINSNARLGNSSFVRATSSFAIDDSVIKSPVKKTVKRDQEVILNPSIESITINKVVSNSNVANDVSMLNSSSAEASTFSAVVKPVVAGAGNGKKIKKHKRRFNNRIMPDIAYAQRTHVSVVSDGSYALKTVQDCTFNKCTSPFISSDEFVQQNGRVNWAVAEELLPVEEISESSHKQ